SSAGHLVERADVESVADVEVVVAVVVLEVLNAPCVVASRGRLVRTARRAFAGRQGVLGVPRRAFGRPAGQSQLHGGGAGSSTAGLVINFRKWPLYRGERGALAQESISGPSVGAADDVELANLGRGRRTIRNHADRAVRDAPEEEVAPLTA